MSSGNPFGLSEICHFGTFQRVGGKAGGFINKKFFHPSSIRNQEKLWKAQTASERETRKQDELQKRRDEERHVEEMRKQLYLAGQGKASDLFMRPSAEGAEQTSASNSKDERREALDQERRRKALVKGEQRRAADGGEEDSGDELRGAAAEAPLARSRYKEDVSTLGHSAVWGSWYAVDRKRWGFQCCKGVDWNTPCPVEAADEATGEVGGASDGDPQGGLQLSKRARRCKAQQRREAEAEADHATLPEAEGDEAGANLQGRGQASGAAGSTAAGEARQKDGDSRTRSRNRSPLMDSKLFKTAERRREQKRRQEIKAEETKPSGYLSDLLRDPVRIG